METGKIRLQDLMCEVEDRLRQLQYAQDTIKSFWFYWRDMLDFAAERQVEYFTTEFGERYLRERHNIDAFSSRAQLGMPKWKVNPPRRAVHLLAEFQNSGSILQKNKSQYTPIPKCYETIAEYFYAVCRNNGKSEGTIADKAFTVKRFLLHLEQKGIRDIDQISDSEISSFLRTTSSWTHRTIVSMLCYLRQFLKFLYEENYIHRELADAVPTVWHGRGGKLPNIWTPEQVQKILDSVDRSNPVGKRDYAILLLVTQLGLRDNDVQNLRFENLLWQECRIRLIQEKTKQPLELPLGEEVGCAIIDYLKYGRPKQDTSDYVFVRHTAPYGRCTNYYHVMKRYLARAGVQFDTQKSRDLHTLRHPYVKPEHTSTRLKNTTFLPRCPALVALTTTQPWRTFSAPCKPNACTRLASPPGPRCSRSLPSTFILQF